MRKRFCSGVSAVVVLTVGFTLAGGAAGLSAQTTSGSTQNCFDPLTGELTNCQSTQIPGNLNLGATPAQGSTTTQTQRTQRATDPYIDPGGLNEENRTQDEGTPQNGQRQPGTRSAVPERPDPATDLQLLSKESSGEVLPLYGRNLFRQAPSTFAPLDQVPVTANYVIGPGDEILLRITGHDALNSRLTVDRSGAIYVPQVGALHVAGTRFEDLQDKLQHDLGSTFRNFTVSANLGKLRSIQIFVLGEARHPGSYTVSSLSTALNALFASGGPTVQGSMRRIQIRRNGAILTELDLYDFILRGDRSHDTTLESGDVVYIPTVGPQVALAGSVRRPAIYETKEGTTLRDVLDLAGGLSSTSARGKISLERIEAHRDRQAMTVSLDPAGEAMVMRDGDVLRAGTVSAGYEKSVTIRGNLQNPGRFPWHPGMRLSEIIPDRMSLLTNDYWKERNRLGVPVPLFQPEERADFLLRNPRRPSTGQNDEVLDTNGNPVGPQSQSTQNDTSGRSLSATDYAAQAARNGIGDNGTRQDLSREVTGVQLRDGESTAARSSLAEQQQSVMNQNLATSARRVNVRLPAAEIDWSYAVIQRLNPDTLRNSLVPFNLGGLVEQHDASQDLELQPGDIVTIFSQSDIHVSQDEQTKFIRLEGEFNSSGVYSVQPNETLAEVIQRAGGLTPRAYLFGASFTRDSARVLQQQRLDDYIAALSVDLERDAARRSVSTAQSSAGVQNLSDSAESRLIARLRQVRATGRIVLEFRPDSSGLTSIPALPMEDGDVFRVPSKPNIVSVVGAVYGQNVFLYNDSRRVRDYLALAGKPNRNGDKKHIFIIRADGAVLSKESVDHVFANNFENIGINPGDTIVVPEKPIRPSALREVIDYSQVFSSFALGAAALNVVR